MKQYSVNPKAEAVSDGIAKIILYSHFFLAFVLLIVGIVQIADCDEFVGIILIVSAFLLSMIGIILWAGLKIFVNMSRTLYNINNAIRGTDSLEPEEEKPEQIHDPVSYICPDCGKTVSEDLEACPHCGCPIDVVKKSTTV